MRQWRWLWSCCPGIGPVKLRALESSAQSAGLGLDDCWRLPRDQLAALLNWPSSLLDRIEQYRSRCGVHPDLRVPTNLLLVGDDSWPSSLDRIDRPPVGLFLRGKRSLLACLRRRQAVAVVGTRAASVRRRRIALGSTTCDGRMAHAQRACRGIDAAVHRGCLEGRGAYRDSGNLPRQGVPPSSRITAGFRW